MSRVARPDVCNGSITIITGEAGAGLSALASRIANIAKRLSVPTLYIPDKVLPAHAYVETEIFKQLGLPLLNTALSPTLRSAAMYRAAFKLRKYEVIVLEDAHLFLIDDYAAKKNVEALVRFARPPYNCDMIILGLNRFTAKLSGLIEAFDFEVKVINLERMQLNKEYHAFVEVVAKDAVRSACSAVGVTPTKQLAYAIIAAEIHAETRGMVGLTVRCVRREVAHKVWEQKSQSAKMLPTDSSSEGESEPDARTRKKWFEGFPKPLFDETLSSWLGRCGAHPDMISFHCNFFARCAQMGRDPDCLYDVVEFKDSFPSHVAKQLPETFRVNSCAVIYEHRTNYCPVCLAEDVAQFRSPSWRQGWMRKGICFCDAHDHLILLRCIDQRTNNAVYKAWLAYGNHVKSGVYDYGINLIARIGDGLQSSTTEQYICMLVERVRKWVYGAQSEFPQVVAEQAPLIYALGFLIHPRFDRCRGGLAVWFLGCNDSTPGYSVFKDPTLAQMLVYIEEASPRQLAVGYILMGIAFELFSASEINAIERGWSFGNYTLPKSRLELVRMTKCFDAPRLRAFARCAIEASGQGFTRISWLFEYYRLLSPSE
ncbi:ATP-binding protein [Pseudomonas fluorescens]|uniref:ATP-binding protein n=1 Tax=Pseudomonas fluorescens TaxID=294 RepID=UPI0037F55740